MAPLIALADHFVPASFARDSDELRRSRLLILFGLATASYGPIFAIAYWLLGAPLLSVGLCVTVALVSLGPFLLRATRSIALAGHYSIGTLAAVLIFHALYTGGLGAPGHYWSVCLPVLGIMIVGRGAGIAWTAFVVLKTVALYALGRGEVLPASLITGERAQALHILSIASLGLLLFTLGSIYESVKERMRAVLASANRELRLLLDNTGQGFLTIARDGAIIGERSAIVDEWLGTPPPGATIGSLVSALDPHAGFALELCWIAGEDLPLELAMLQLPARMRRGEQHLSLAYRPILRDGKLDRMLVVISDVTSEVARERAERAEAELLFLVKRLMSDRASVRDFFAEAREQCERLSSPTTSDLAALRDLHTLKGNCSLFGLIEVAAACHRLEEAVASRSLPPTLDERRQIAAVWERSAGAVASLLEGDPDRDVEISLAEHAEFLRLLEDGAPTPKLQELAASWAHEPAARRLGRLGEGAAALAERLGKPGLEVVIADHGVRVPRAGWQELWDALIHLIRNAVDHGIERPSERRAAGKEPGGRLTLRTTVGSEATVIEVSDDGGGVDWGRVRRGAEARGLPASSQADLEAALFLDGFSTREAPSEISGRGVGMAVVQASCAALGARLSITSSPGAGTTFRIEIPHAEGRPRATSTRIDLPPLDALE